MKEALVTTTIINEEEYAGLVAEQESEYQLILSQLESFCEFITEDIDFIVNK